MNFLEKDLEDVIWENTQSKEGLQKLEDRGLSLIGKHFIRQLNLGPYGIADIVGFTIGVYRTDFDQHSISVQVDVVELKKDKINNTCINQTLRYLDGIKQFVSEYLKKHSIKEKFQFVHLSYEAHLIGSGMSLDSCAFIYNNTPKCFTAYSYSFDIDKGLLFKSLEKNYRYIYSPLKTVKLSDSEIIKGVGLNTFI